MVRKGRTRNVMGTATLVGIGLTIVTIGPAFADTLEWALAQAYQNNPQLNSQRAVARQADEGVPIALSGYRPKIAATANLGEQYQSTVAKALTPPPAGSGITSAGPGA